jgi:pimeloyl-ACP methyl ester carboxylesterase
MVRGDATYLTRIAERRFNELRAINVMSVATDCASGASTARKARIRREVTGTVLGDIGNIFFDRRCAAVDVPDLGDEFRGLLRSNVPTLFISGSLDSQTPPEQVEEIRRGFTQSVHIVVENAGHESTLPDGRVQDLMVRFYRGEALRDTTIALPPVRFVVR